MIPPAFPDIARVLTLVEALEPRSVLLVGIGWGELAANIRFVRDARHGRFARPDWQCRIEGVEPFAEFENALWPQILDHFETGNPLDLLQSKGRFDLVILRHVLEGMSREDGARLIELARSLSNRVLVVAAQTPDAYPAPPSGRRFAVDIGVPVPFLVWTDQDFAGISRVTPDADEALVTLLDGHHRKQAPAIKRDVSVCVLVWAETVSNLAASVESLARQSVPPREIRIAGPGVPGDLTLVSGFRDWPPVVPCRAPDADFALAEAAHANPDGAIAVLASGTVAHEDWVGALDVAFGNRLLGLAGGPVGLTLASGAETPPWWHRDFEGPAMLLGGDTEVRTLDPAGCETLSPLAFAVRASLVKGLDPAGGKARTFQEACFDLHEIARRQGLVVMLLPAIESGLVADASALDLGKLLDSAFLQGKCIAEETWETPQRAARFAIQSLKETARSCAETGQPLCRLAPELRIGPSRALGAAAWALDASDDASFDREVQDAIGELQSVGGLLDGLPWEAFKASVGSEDREAPLALLCAPDWESDDWKQAVTAYLAAFEPSTRVALVLLAREGQDLDSVGGAVLETISAAGKDPEAIPDVVIQPSTFDTANLLAWIDRSAAVLSVGGVVESPLVTLSSQNGCPVEAELAPDVLTRLARW